MGMPPPSKKMGHGGKKNSQPIREVHRFLCQIILMVLQTINHLVSLQD